MRLSPPKSSLPFAALAAAVSILALCILPPSSASGAGTGLSTFFRRLSPGGGGRGKGVGTKSATYTPLVFFTAPTGEMAECDYMEGVVSSVERELNVRAQRFDVVRDRTARILFDKIDSSGKQIMPMLYNRESRQIVRGPVDGNRVRAWAKGRWLSADYRASLPSDLYGDDGKGETDHADAI